MKNLLFFSFLLLGYAQLKANRFDFVKPKPESPCTVSVCVNITGNLGIKTQNCKKIGLSCFDISVGVTSEARNFSNPPSTGTTLLLTKLSATQLEIAFRSNETGPLVIDQPIALGAKLSSALGASSITLKPGTYLTSKRADGSFSAIVSIY
jgi:hypothetical protein